MNALTDIIFSSILGGFIILIILNANFMIRDTWAQYNSDYIIQQRLISNAQIVESEFRNMGCGVKVAQESIVEAWDTCIAFRLALRPEPNTPITTVKYFSGSTDELLQTENPRDRFLYRQQEGGELERVGIVTQFTLRYFNAQGDLLETPILDTVILRSIRLVEITMEVQSPSPAGVTGDGTKYYSTTLWKQTRLASQNLNR